MNALIRSCFLPMTAVVNIVLVTTAQAAPIIWNGPSITVTKAPFADPISAADRLTDNVWLTRGNVFGLYNAKLETSYDNSLGAANPQPTDTRWAIGSSSNLSSLTFDTWIRTINSMPPQMVGKNMVLHLVSEEIYVDIRFTEWGVSSGAGGSFSYVRSTPGTSVPEASSFVLIAGAIASLPAIRLFCLPINRTVTE